MERLKAILADKILDLSIGNGDEVKAKLDKISRFRDFANACQSLMIKYPRIEDELIKMVNDGDFDTKVASSRVDTIIRLSETEAGQTNKINSTVVESEPVIIDDEVENELMSEGSDELDLEEVEADIQSEIDDIPMEVVDMQEESFDEAENISYEDVNSEPDTITEEILQEQSYDTEQEDTLDSIEEFAAAKRKTTIRRVIQVLGIVVAVVALIFIIKFVMTHWQAILIIAGVLVILAILFVWFKRKSN